MRPRAIGALVCAMVVVPTGAGAICGRAPPVHVWPHGKTAPTNARIAMTMPKDFRAGSALSLRTAPVRGAPSRTTIATRNRTWITSDFERAELVPSSALAPRTAYEVWTARGEILGVFTTGDGTDITPPSWVGVKAVRFYRTAPRPGIVTLSMECGSPRLVLDSDTPASDDQTAASDILYALWAEPLGTKLDYTKPPRSIVVAGPAFGRGFTLYFGNDSYDDDIDLPRANVLTIGVRAIDLAGNASAPSELTAR
jgi:hypothetical protein